MNVSICQELTNHNEHSPHVRGVLFPSIFIFGCWLSVNRGSLPFIYKLSTRHSFTNLLTLNAWVIHRRSYVRTFNKPWNYKVSIELENMKHTSLWQRMHLHIQVSRYLNIGLQTYLVPTYMRRHERSRNQYFFKMANISVLTISLVRDMEISHVDIY